MNVRNLIPGFRFRDGKLMFFTEQEIRIIHAWPDLRAARKDPAAGNWRPFTPCSRLLRRTAQAEGKEPDDQFGFAEVKSQAVDPLFEKQLAFANFRYSVPPPIAQAVEPFRSRHWMLLSVCQQQPRTKDLLTQTPALGFALAHNHKFRSIIGDPLKIAASLSAKKQREVVGWLGFPKSQAWVNILAKIPAEVVSLPPLLALREVSSHDAIEKLLCHLPRINAGVLGLITDARFASLISPRLLAETAESANETMASPTAQALADILGLGDRMSIAEPLKPFASVESLRRKQQETVADYIKFIRLEEPEGRLPEPPLPGTASIVPLVLVSQLAEEGRSQHHCVHSYADRVKAGRCYIYRILAPERATLSVVKGEDGSWEIEQLNLSCNRPAAPKTQQAVQAWLSRYSLSA